MDGWTDTSAHERALIELAQWFARIQQYSASHPACADLGRRAHSSLSEALNQSAPLIVSVSKDGLALFGTPTTHRVLNARFGPHLHERGVLAIRFALGVRVDELT